jgi:pyruvate,water dikinase
VAAAHPAVAEAIKGGRYDDIAAAAGGPEFLAELKAYLDIYGWRAPSWGQVHLATWAEDPAVPLGLIASYLSDPEHAPAAAQRRARQERNAAIAEMEARLAPEKLPRFRELLRAAQESVPVSEGRAMWQLISSAILRFPLLALGRKLAADGVIDSADDVFYFSVDELTDTANGRPAPDTRGLISQRRAQLERWEKLTPPASRR